MPIGKIPCNIKNMLPVKIFAQVCVCIYIAHKKKVPNFISILKVPIKHSYLKYFPCLTTDFDQKLLLRGTKQEMKE